MLLQLLCFLPLLLPLLLLLPLPLPLLLPLLLLPGTVLTSGVGTHSLTCKQQQQRTAGRVQVSLLMDESLLYL
jgi:hypothetical protein